MCIYLHFFYPLPINECDTEWQKLATVDLLLRLFIYLFMYLVTIYCLIYLYFFHPLSINECGAEYQKLARVDLLFRFPHLFIYVFIY